MSDQRKGQATFREVFQVGEFQALWWGQILSIGGDQLARVALTLLVYARTHSAALTALTYALTFLPDLISRPLLSGLADRYPRREVMVIADVSRALLVGVMAIPGLPFAAVCVLLVAVQFLNAPFNAARGAMLPNILTGDRYVTGQAVMTITNQTGQLAGYVLGGVLLQFSTPSVALLIDAGTFAVSALLVRFGVLHRPAATKAADPERGELAATWLSLRSGVNLVWRDRMLRTLVWLACLSGFYVISEGLAVPYARELGGGALLTGLVFAALPIGNALGVLLLTRLVPPDTRMRLVPLLAVASSAVLVICAATHNTVATLVVLVTCGGLAAYQIVAASAFVRAVPDAERGQAFGLANTGIRVSQGLGVVAAGAFADSWSPSVVVAVFGAAGAVVALAAMLSYRRAVAIPATVKRASA
ncbi:MAG TPA: MFS transporter [Pseudonocardiaceae bacterium]|nr:MFS transporter [Pseudonocardiaceae bacterium]